MTGKELVIVMAGMALAAGGAGLGVAMYAGPSEAPVDRTAEILERFDGLDEAIEKTSNESRRNRRTLENISDRLTEVELGLDKVNTEQAAAAKVRTTLPGEGVAMHGAPGGLTSTDADGNVVRAPVTRFRGKPGMKLDVGELMKGATGALEGMEIDVPDEVKAQLAEAIQSGDVADMFAGMQRGMELRQLPEGERWQKAQDELGLGFNQVEELKAATADRDAAMKEAMVVQRDEETEDGGRFVMKRMDSAKAADAQAKYNERVNNTLTEDQRKDWNKKGYANAFGDGHGMGGHGGATVISVTSSTTTTTNPVGGTDLTDEK